MAEKSLLDEVIQKTIEFKNDDNLQVVLDEDIIRKAYAPPDATDQEWRVFKAIAQQQRLDPTQYEIYFTRQQGRMVPVVGYRKYISRALKSGKFDKPPIVKVVKPDPDDKDTWVATFTTKRLDQTVDFEWEVPYREAGYMQSKQDGKTVIVPRRGTWEVQPEFQLKKTCIVQSYRIIGADVVGGLPNIVEEISIEDTEETLKSESPTQSQRPNEKEKSAEPNGNEKQKAIDAVKAKLDSFQTISEIDAWETKEKKAIAKSKIKNEIEAMIKSKRFEITVETLAKIMSIDQQSIADFLITAEPVETVIRDVMAGDSDAIDELAKMIVNFQNAQSQQIDEMAEPDLDMLADARSIHNDPS